MESWLPVDGWPYEVSDKGRVRRTLRAPGTRPGLVLRPHATNRGYLRVQLRSENKPKHVAVHRLVAGAFVPSRRGAPYVNHIDGDRTNNCAENLEWVTQSENQIHAYATGLQGLGAKHGRSKLTEGQVEEIIARHAAGETQTALAREYPVNQSMISKIVRGEFWKRRTE